MHFLISAVGTEEGKEIDGARNDSVHELKYCKDAWTVMEIVIAI